MGLNSKHIKVKSRCAYGHAPIRYKTSGYCVECTSIKSKRWRDKNPLYFPTRNKHYYKSNLEYEKARRIARAKNHKEERRVINRNRRARQKNAIGSHNKSDIAKLFIKQKGKCLCGFQFGKFHVDHKRPLSRKGSNWPRNLQLLCQPCNDSKGSKTMREWGGPYIT